MRVVQNLSLTAKLALAPALVVVCLLLSSLCALFTNQRTATSIDRVATQGLPSIMQAGALKAQLAQAQALVMQSVAYEGAELKPATIAAIDKQVPLAFQRLHAQVAALKAASAGRTDRAERLDQIEAGVKKLERSALQTVDMKGVGLATAAISLTASDEAYRGLQQQVSALIEVENTAGMAQAALASAAVDFGNRAAAMIGAAALALALAVTWVCVRLVRRPLERAVGIAEAVAAGDLRDRQADEAAAGRDASGQVLRALAQVAQRLNATLTGIRASAGEIDSASQEIAAGNDDLSQRTERTAASLRETASTMEQLSAAVRQNADTAASAQRVTEQAVGIARDGGEAVGGVVRTMDDINAQAKKISDIIGVIDGIAFQTNILALNASVEAARAGEGGRGFAVVAQEVRALAGRSAVAAKEIRSLIVHSVETIESGTLMMRRAGDTVSRIVGSIDQVSAMAAQIASASDEQVRGFESVNRAVGEMDRATEQNAALVEQAAAATESLKRQTAGMLAAVSVFTTA